MKCLCAEKIFLVWLIKPFIFFSVRAVRKASDFGWVLLCDDLQRNKTPSIRILFMLSARNFSELAMQSIFFSIDWISNIFLEIFSKIMFRFSYCRLVWVSVRERVFYRRQLKYRLDTHAEKRVFGGGGLPPKKPCLLFSSVSSESSGSIISTVAFR